MLKGGAMATINISDAHMPHLLRLSEACEMELPKLVNLIIATGIESLDNPHVCASEEDVSIEQLALLFPEDG
jgi:hypothetical protein